MVPIYKYVYTWMEYTFKKTGACPMRRQSAGIWTSASETIQCLHITWGPC